MRCAFQPCHWVVVAFKTYRFGVAYLMHYLDALAGFAYAEAFAVEYVLVTLGVQFGEAAAELELVAVDGDGAVGAFLALHCIFG